MMTGFSKSNKQTITTYETPSTDTQEQIGWDGKLVDKLVNLPAIAGQSAFLSLHFGFVEISQNNEIIIFEK